MNGTILQSNATCVLEIDPEPLTLNIDGGSFRQVSNTGNVSVKAAIDLTMHRGKNSGGIKFQLVAVKGTIGKKV